VASVKKKATSEPAEIDLFCKIDSVAGDNSSRSARRET
jgi:hypothetical protein